MIRPKSPQILALAASAPGRSHVNSGIPCQDAFKSRSLPGSMGGVCVCDGAGSQAHSRTGAELVSGWVLQLVKKNHQAYSVAHDFAREDILSSLRKRLDAHAAKHGLQAQQLACTVVFSFMWTQDSCLHYLCGHLGDGIIIIKEDATPRLFSLPDNGEHANSTWFVTSEDALEHFRIYSGTLSPAQAPGFVVATDGSAHKLCGYASKNVAPAVGSLFEDNQSLSRKKFGEVLTMLVSDILAPASADDCSVGIVQMVEKTRRKISSRSPPKSKVKSSSRDL